MESTLAPHGRLSLVFHRSTDTVNKFKLSLIIFKKTTESQVGCMEQLASYSIRVIGTRISGN